MFSKKLPFWPTFNFSDKKSYIKKKSKYLPLFSGKHHFKFCLSDTIFTFIGKADNG